MIHFLITSYFRGAETNLARHVFYCMNIVVCVVSPFSKKRNHRKTEFVFMDCSSMFITFSASIFASICSSIFHGKWLPKWSGARHRSPQKSILFGTFSEHRFRLPAAIVPPPGLGRRGSTGGCVIFVYVLHSLILFTCVFGG